MRGVVRAGVRGVLEGHRDVADLRVARRLEVPVVERDADLVHRAPAETLLVDARRAEVGGRRRSGSVSWLIGRQDQELVFGKRLLGDDRPRKVGVAARPAAFLAEAAHVGDEPGDLLGGQRVFEPRHLGDRPTPGPPFAIARSQSASGSAVVSLQSVKSIGTTVMVGSLTLPVPSSA